jgi:hypothetical protein
MVRPRAMRSAILVAAGLLAGCGGASAAAGGSSSSLRPITKGQAEGYARAVNLQAGDLSGFTSSSGVEAEAPKPERLGVEYDHCRGGVSLVHRIAHIYSTELSAGSGLNSKFMKSIVEVWATPALVARNNKSSHSSRGKSCFVRFLNAVRRRSNQERRGRRPIGPFTISIVPNPLPGASHSFRTRIDETRLLRTGALRAHIYRDIFGFVVGPAEIELEATGIGRPAADPTEAKALQLLLNRATANAIRLH